MGLRTFVGELSLVHSGIKDLHCHINAEIASFDYVGCATRSNEVLLLVILQLLLNVRVHFLEPEGSPS